MSVSRKEERAMLRYVKRVREELGLPKLASSFFGWQYAFDPKRERIVRKAPKHLGYAIGLWYKVRKMAENEGYNSTERGQMLSKHCREISERVHAEVRRLTSRHPHLELRSNGWFVQGIPSSEPILKIVR